jgi:uncharacterized membrane protein
MHILKKNVFLLFIGGSAYAVIELMWRGRTHITMVLAGGLSLIFFSLIENYFRERSILFRAGLCSLAVTGIELIFGIIFNLIFGMAVWDYRDQPFNLFGQICPLFSFVWGVLALIVLPIVDLLNNFFDNGKLRKI